MKFNNSLSKDKGVAGLTILLSLVTMLFVIGLLVFIFAIMGIEIRDSSSLSAGESASATQVLMYLNDTADTLTICDDAIEGVATVIAVSNDSGPALPLGVGNYTLSGCTIVSASDGLYNGSTTINATYTYTFAGAGWTVVNDTTTSISSVTDWYDIFIVIGAMIVLILLTVIIITSVRGSGLMGGGASGKGGRGTSGTA